MCRRVQCEICQKPSFTGCGRHVDQVLKNVAEEDRCHCRGNAQRTVTNATAMVASKLQSSAA